MSGAWNSTSRPTPSAPAAAGAARARGVRRRPGSALAALAALGLVCALAPVARAQGQPGAADLERRVRELEELVGRLQRELAEVRAAPHAPPAPPPEETLPVPRALGLSAPAPHPTFPPAPHPALDGPALPPPPADGLERRRTGDADREAGPVTAGWNDCFFLQSADQMFVLRVTGQVQADLRDFLDDGDTADTDTFLVRRARLGVEANLLKHYEFRLMADFGQGQARLVDAYLNVHYWDAFQVEGGRFKQPFSYEQLIQDRFVPTVERSLIDQLVPARDVGVAVHGQKLLNDRLDYGVSVFNGENNGELDTNDAKDVAARLALRPFRCWDAVPVCRWLQVGVSVGFGNEEEPVRPATLRTPATVPWFQFNPAVRADGRRTRWSPELAYFRGPFGLAAQYFRQDQELRPSQLSSVLVDVPFEGYYVLATWLLTGEERTTYSQAVAPHAPFDPRHPWRGPGAWELVVRLSRLRLGEEVFAPGPARLADPSRFSAGATELTFGFNWYLNRWVRAQLNWEHAWFDDPVRLGEGQSGLLRRQDTLLTRLQVIF